MPLAISFRAPATVQVTAAGRVTFAEVAVLIDDLLDDDRIGDGTCILVDATRVQVVPSTPELRMIARDLKPLHERGVDRIAVVAESAFVYGIARMFAVFAEMMGVRVAAFRSMEEGERWITGAMAA